MVKNGKIKKWGGKRWQMVKNGKMEKTVNGAGKAELVTACEIWQAKCLNRYDLRAPSCGAFR